MGLGSITYVSVTWTTGDIITETKLDNMVGNDQAYDAHAAQGILLNNNVGFYQKQSGGTNSSLLNLNGSNITEFGYSGGNLKYNSHWDGWVAAPTTYTFTYSNYAAGTRVALITATGIQNYAKLGMRIKFSQTTDGVKYGIVHKVVTDTLTVFLPVGTDFDNETISNVYFSSVYCPDGFDCTPSLWELEYSSAADGSQASPVTNTWYNLGTATLTVGSGAWKAEYSANFKVLNTSATDVYGAVELSTANNASSETELQTHIRLNAAGNGANQLQMIANVRGTRNILITAQTAYYLIARALVSLTNISFIGTQGNTRILFTSAFV